MSNRSLSEIKAKIRHFLLKNSSYYRREITNGSAKPPISAIAKQLHKVCPIGERRLQKYLYETTCEKDLNISLSDLFAFSELANSSIGSFIAYLFEEEAAKGDLNEKQLNILKFYSKLNLRDRRRLSLKVFNPDNFSRGEEVIRAAINIASMNQAEREAIIKLIDVFSSKPL